MPTMCDIDKLKKVIQEIKDDYKAEASGKKLSRRWLQDFNKEVQELKQYRGREILELLQNADDAKSDKVIIIHDTHLNKLRITNSGDATELFSNKGFESILFANLSSKQGLNFIGEKGLGFRSVLNWASSIEIQSGNVSLKFNEANTFEFWHEMKELMSRTAVNSSVYEKTAEGANRKAPLAILSLPQIEKLTNGINETTITLDYRPDKQDEITNELMAIKPYSLLFLHNIKAVKIKENGCVKKDFRRTESVSDNGITKIFVNDEEWVVSSEKGVNNGKQYEASCAYAPNENLDEPVYTFFPTETYFNLPYILHATFNLDSSRKSLIEKDEENEFMIKKLSECVKRIADYLKCTTRGNEPNWSIFRFMRPDRTKQTQNEYCKLIYDCLYKVDGDFVPVLGGGYGNERDVFFYDSKLFDFLKEDGKNVFADMCCSGIPKYAEEIIDLKDNRERERIELYAKEIQNYSRLAEFIKLLVDFITA